mgnify:CR=1 FL=1
MPTWLDQSKPQFAAEFAKLLGAKREAAADVGAAVAKIIADSYHTVWFELHKELITLAGLNHEVEARAGHAT